jgi:hypothetical protein
MPQNSDMARRHSPMPSRRRKRHPGISITVNITTAPEHSCRRHSEEGRTDRGPTLPANAPDLDLPGNMHAARDVRLDDSPLAQVLETCARRRQGEDGVLEAGAARCLCLPVGSLAAAKSGKMLPFFSLSAKKTVFNEITRLMMSFICSCRNNNQPNAIYPLGTFHRGLKKARVMMLPSCP